MWRDTLVDQRTYKVYQCVKAMTICLCIPGHHAEMTSSVAADATAWNQPRVALSRVRNQPAREAMNEFLKGKGASCIYQETCLSNPIQQ
jgi:hypothetical protein